ncbi:MAG: hypothetical protein H0X43_10005 [Nitrosospira sp.]|nr:hypothetical protein [Nitrosospira sp.]
MIKNLTDNDETWLDQLGMLVVKFSQMGIGGEVASMSPEEKRGLFVYLRSLSDG